MIEIMADPINVEALESLDMMDKNVRAGVRKGLYLLGKKLVKDTSQAILKRPRGGTTRRVRRGRRVVTHTASQPGEAPANITGKLRKSLDFKVKGADELEFGYDAVEYGKYLELGTQKMEARPGLKNSINDNKQDGVDYLEREIRKALN